ncbi:hypothetical protein GCM10009777_11660 [Microbacterium pumilum]|uniref:XRE family transcriptional regulator n=1 Tax=Microbacterium pumilum TaxID=344165 RepID=A0ABP5DGJ2_9MICO
MPTVRDVLRRREPELSVVSLRALATLPRVRPHLTESPDEGISLVDLLRMIEIFDVTPRRSRGGPEQRGPEFPGPDFPEPIRPTL